MKKWINEAVPPKLKWLGNLKTVHDGTWPRPEGIKDEPEYVSKADFGEVVIYCYAYKWTEGGWIGNAPQSYMILWNNKVVAKSDKIQTGDEVTKEAEKAYTKLAKQVNSSIEIPKGKKVSDPQENEWVDQIPERKEKVIKALGDMIEFEATGEIYKSDWTAIKDIMDNAFLYAQDKCFDASMLAADITGEELKTIKNLYAEYAKNKRVVHLEKALSEIGKSEGTKFFVQMFVKPAVEIYKKLDDLKGKIKSGRKPVVNPAKAAYVPPPSARKDIEKVNAVYEELLRDTKKQLIDSLFKNLCKRAEGLLKYLKETDAEMLKRRGAIDWSAVTHWLDSNKAGYSHDSSYDFSGYTLKKNYKDIAMSGAIRDAEDIQRQFIYKNLRKVCSIVGERGGLKDAVVLKINFVGRLEGRLRFTFEDGSEFSVNNQVVFVWGNGERKEHHRFPTTFHDIVFASGRKSKMESEEFMNQVWAKEKLMPENMNLAETILHMHEDINV